MISNNVDVDVLVSNTKIKLEINHIDGIRVIKAPEFGRISSAPTNFTFPFLLRKYGYDADLLHFHLPNPTAVLAYMVSGLKKPIIATYHSDIIRQDKLVKFYSPFRKLFLEFSDRIIATSPNYIRTSNVLKHFKHKCTVIPLGINIERFCVNSDKQNIQNIRKKNKNLPLILFVGCFRYYKGLEFVISAMKEVKAKLLLIGSGPEEKKLRSIVSCNNMGKKVHFLGELPDEEVNEYYKACDIFVLPSNLRSEAFGLVQLEAMCCSKPVISTELGTGTSFVNQDGQTGIVVQPNNISSLAKAINFLISNPDIRLTLGACGTTRVKQLFTASCMVNKTLKLYQEVLANKKSFPLKTNEQPICTKQHDHKIRILRVVSRLNIGGPSLNVKYLTEGINNEKFQTKIISGAVSPNEGDMSYITQFKDNIRINVPELQREINFYKDFLALIKIIKIVFSYQPDIIHSHTSKAGTLARCAATVFNLFSKQKTIVIHTYHGHVLAGYFSTLKSYFVNRIEKSLAKVTDAIIAISQTQKWELTVKYNLATPEKVHIINLGFDLTRFLDVKGKLRTELGVRKDTLLIGIVGRLVPIKNHWLFLNSAKLIKEKYTDKSIRFIIIGDGELRSRLEDYARKIDIINEVIFYGWEKEIEKIYADLDILVLTSNNEGTPVSIIESMAASVPVVTTGVGGVKDLLGRIENSSFKRDDFLICERGILCPKGNAEAVANGVQYLIENDNHELLANARDFVFKNYTSKRLIEKIECLYQNLI